MKIWTIEPKEILYEYEQPLLYTFEHSWETGIEGQLYLGYMSDFDTLLAVEITDAEVATFKEGATPLLDILSKDKVLKFARNFPGEENEWCFLMILVNGMDDIPADYKPRPGTCYK